MEGNSLTGDRDKVGQSSAPEIIELLMQLVRYIVV